MEKRLENWSQYTGETTPGTNDSNYIGNGPDAMIYLGKCTFQYELYNPCNYNQIIYIYDLTLKRDTQETIDYSVVNSTSGQPESAMYKGYFKLSSTNSGTGSWTISDPTKELNGAVPFSVGNKPTDSHYFNLFWKVRAVKKLVLPPGTTHHHNVIYNPKKVLTQASLLGSHVDWNRNEKYGVRGITQATLFGFEGQVVGEGKDDQHTFINTNKVATLPGRIVVKCIKKVNVWNVALQAQTIIQDDSLAQVEEPVIWTDLHPAEPNTATDAMEQEQEQQPST